ncbi:DUF1499 domain-containing protein [Leptothoe sp. EHU-05/26/07-4]|uniref:DUF1499 domain-containing protein n=1 Tax=Adonisia turfae CCMR0081 TaxID=2292702 RepID=A0A6M0RXH0_9CYAN|nr:DUF1499 domain-containing protein [Adonisia turfae]NEZ60938.1 DUF1499 domain-containing protein [Adonisia turfae CCMR0081]
MQLFRVLLPLLVAVCLVFTSAPAVAAPIAVLPGLQGVFTGTPPTNIGIHDAQLIACPTSPNCVSSSASDDEHYIAPIEYTADKDAVRDQLVAIINNQPRTEIIEQTDDYILVEFTSRLMGFVDDAEFYFLQDGNSIAMRSAARLGESDLGVNRRRLEQFRLALQSLGA